MIRALVLAAGRGERLRPLTDATPKPLLPVLGVPVVERTLRRLADAGVDAAAVNLHHLGEHIQTSLGARVESMPLTYSSEEELLGTLGPLARLASFLAGADPVLLVNGDSLCDWPVESLVEAHRTGGAPATLLISATADPGRFGGGVSIDSEGRVLSLRGAAPPETARRGVFAGLHAISPGLLEDLAERPSDIVRDLYEPLLAAGATIRAVFTERRWHDLGTPRRYLAGVLDEASTLGGTWRHATAVVSEGARVERTVLEAGAVVERGAVAEGSLLLPGSRLGAGARLIDSILGPGVEAPTGLAFEGLLLTAGGSAGSLVATPLAG